MNPWDILAIVLCIAVIALVGFTIPILIQVKDLLKIGETTLNRIEKEIEPVIQNVEGITGNFEGITGVANRYVHRNKPGIVENVKESVKDSSKVVMKQYIPKISKQANRYLAAFKTGLKVGIYRYKHSKNGIFSVINSQHEPGSLHSDQVAEDIVIVNHQIIKR
jgi:uncharacterized protein YoxC